MKSDAKSLSFFIGWDVGGWNCDNNPNSRDATGEQRAVSDLAWPNGIQEELSQAVAVLLNESTETIGIASQAGCRCFTSIDEFRRYVENDILAGGSHA